MRTLNPKWNLWKYSGYFLTTEFGEKFSQKETCIIWNVSILGYVRRLKVVSGVPKADNVMGAETTSSRAPV